jgi:hypothetical protein
MEPESSISLHEWQRSINDRIKSPFPQELYQPTPSPPPPVPKLPQGTVNMHPPIHRSQNSNRNTMPTSMSHKSLSQSVSSNLSAALSSVTSPSSRRKSRVLSPSELKRVRDADQASMTRADSTTPPPPPATGSQQRCFEDEQQESLNAEKVLEQAMRHHQQRRNQQRLGGPGSLKSKASTLSTKESAPSSPKQMHASLAIRSGTTLPPTSVEASPLGLSIASFEELIKELEEEEEERKRKEELTVSQPPKTTPPPVSMPPDVVVPQPQSQPEPQPPLNRPSALNNVKRRSTGSILFSQPLTPTLPLDIENLYPFSMDRKVSLSAQQSRISVASFGSTKSDGKRNSAHEVTFNFVDWSAIAGGCAVSERRASREFSAMMVRSKSGFGEFDESRRISSTYNFGRRGSVF